MGRKKGSAFTVVLAVVLPIGSGYGPILMESSQAQEETSPSPVSRLQHLSTEDLEDVQGEIHQAYEWKVN